MKREGQTEFTNAAVANAYGRGDVGYDQALYHLEDKERIAPPA